MKWTSSTHGEKIVKLLLLNHWISSISTSLGLKNKTTHSLHGLRHTRQKTNGYTTKRRYQQTRRDKQKTPEIMKDQLGKKNYILFVGKPERRTTWRMEF
jgi:hypothetical protein